MERMSQPGNFEKGRLGNVNLGIESGGAIEAPSQPGSLEKGALGGELGMEAVQALEAPTERILGILEEDIRAGNFGLILGEDASGRVPALIIHKALKEISEELGQSAPGINFVAGGGRWFIHPSEKIRIYSEPDLADEVNRAREEKISKITEYFESLSQKIGDKKVLLVTDAVETGKSLKTLCVALDAAGIQFEIAVIGSDSHLTPDGISEIEAALGHKMAIGQSKIPDISQEGKYSGVTKEPKDLHSHRRKPIWYSDAGNLYMKLTREAVPQIASRIAKSFLAK